MDRLGSADILEFGRFRLDRRGRCLFRLDQGGKAALVPLGRTALDVLDMLVGAQGELVEREKIMQTVWRGKIVEEANLAVQISNLRDIIGRSRIQTISGRGYRFVAPIKQPDINGQSTIRTPQGGYQPRPRLSIVVLPFTNLSEDKNQQYFADGITDDLTTDLSRIGDTLVISRNTAFAYRDKPVDTKQIGRELGVRYLLEGSVRRLSKQVRVNVQLIDTETDTHLWAERFERHFSELLQLQDEITTAIVGAIEPELLKSERNRIASQRGHSRSAYEFYQRGMWHQYRISKEDNTQAQTLFRRALEMDPEYPQVTAFLAIAVCNAAYLGWAEDAERNYAEAYKLAEQAVSLDARCAASHFSLGLVCMWTHRCDQAVAALREAINLNPSYAAAYVLLGQMHLYRGQPGEALAFAEKGIRLSPRDPRLFMWLPALAGAHYQLRRYAEAIDIGRRSWTLNRNWPAGLRYVVAGLAQLGRTDEARAALEQLRVLNPNLAFVEGNLERLYQERAAVEHILDGLRKAGFQ